MKVRVVAPFEINGLSADGMLAVPAGTRVRDILKRSRSIARTLMVLPVMVNGKQVKATHILNDGDTLVIVFPISGG
jgi:sulfur carrier protein ThiS